ncbi:hypothetical protein JMUB3935_1631 [Leptotrichia trevisanii]|uniref:Uncharacterized protein n=1 Tax=Leptotrichia trevisanii TaxID=109328 RepID=A0A510KLS7_9FUSO|nr:DUF6037 family protein [Leptotrichia trevisanii]BBM52652.1 hypothetical protein JMUB3935_1631 [Leptotrichia trevisanii]
MGDIRFKKLPLLLNDMEKKKWIIDSFPFEYNGVNTIVILRRYTESKKKPNKYAKAEIEFIDENNIEHMICGYIDLYEVYFDNAIKFYNFFRIEGDNNSPRELFLNFSEYFSEFIPKEKIIIKENNTEKEILAKRIDKNDNGIYCFDVRRNGPKKDGSLKKRKPKNSNKAELLRPFLYQKYKGDINLSFYFSPNPEDELSDEEILRKIASR